MSVKFSFLIFFLLIVSLLFSQTGTTIEPNSSKLSRKEKRKMAQAREDQLQKELNGFAEASVEILCEIFGDDLQVAVIPFSVDANAGEATNPETGSVFAEYMEAKLPKLGWTVIGKERTKQYINSLERIVQRNVHNEEELRDLKKLIGADVIVTGVVYSYYKGTKGSPGTHVSFSVRCQLLETACREVWAATVESRSGAYSYDKSPVFQLKTAMKVLINDLVLKVEDCKNDE